MDNKQLQIDAARAAMRKVADYIESRKLTGKACLTPEATGGYNLACDFLAHELRKMAEAPNEKLLG